MKLMATQADPLRRMLTLWAEEAGRPRDGRPESTPSLADVTEVGWQVRARLDAGERVQSVAGAVVVAAWAGTARLPAPMVAADATSAVDDTDEAPWVGICQVK